MNHRQDISYISGGRRTREFGRSSVSPAPPIGSTSLCARRDAVRLWGGCSPDLFGFDAKDELHYRGRMDESRMQLVKGARRELHEAMKLIAETGHGPKNQIASMGCSIKWGWEDHHSRISAILASKLVRKIARSVNSVRSGDLCTSVKASSEYVALGRISGEMRSNRREGGCRP